MITGNRQNKKRIGGPVISETGHQSWTTPIVMGQYCHTDNQYYFARTFIVTIVNNSNNNRDTI